MNKRRILIVDDEEHILELIRYNLEKSGFEVLTSDDGEDALKLLETTVVDMVILDLMLPGIDGIEVCKQIRRTKEFDKLPIIMLTAKGEETDRILGLELGADDYVTKPFSIRELTARVKAILRRTEDTLSSEGRILKLKDIVLDLEKHEVTVDGEIVELTLKEFALLKILMENRGKVLSRDVLLDEVWGYDYFGETRTVDVHIRHLRKKIGDDETIKYIDTIRGIGYKMK
ncbi:two-component system, OmpR family, alkaline phosphatase synthesis response regulator PhoP [Natronincola peptidivorans]|uniref:Stage 0 sporulation protein A homolog n=1 Tax=Natronincola peptidivorans TaxID=426128 RepID=A0A1I0F1D3_9FIRM|nr:response regulator transcription factor [Natronincola peptidivorans]SET51790.1 two-component system, OmpR family, alkaline phosphatase synthesis response regulator PhoP [Natronincola peptidivorans]